MSKVWGPIDFRSGSIAAVRYWEVLFLIAVSLEHSVRDEHLPSIASGRRATSPAPFGECFRINEYPHDDVTVGLKSVLHLSGHLLPFRPCRRQLVPVV